MIFFPAIDIKDGKCIRLKKGLLKNIKFYNEDPVDQAIQFRQMGCEWIHVVDIDGAFSGSPKNHEIIFDIKKRSGCKVQVGGGIRTQETIEDFINNGIDRVILGTIAMKNPDFVKSVCKKFFGRIAVGIDSKDEKVATEGWSKTSKTSIVELIKLYKNAGVASVIFTDIEKDGLLEGMNYKQIKKILDSTKLNIIASGGVSSLSDLEKLKKLKNKNLEGVISGKAIYEGKFLVKDALKVLC